MTSKITDTFATAKSAVSSAKNGTEHAAAGARSKLMEGVVVMTGIVNAARALGLNDALGWIGLSRKTSALGSFAIFGAGMAVGAGLGALLTPMSGAELRRAILKPLQGKAKYVVDAVTTEVVSVEQAVEEVVRSAMPTVEVVEPIIDAEEPAVAAPAARSVPLEDYKSARHGSSVNPNNTRQYVNKSGHRAGN